ncbi:hypothetical protein, partial [Bacillus cereus]|uniref:hypothetical protein n=1 Tax=Bacillus cereus TaxID=1396 RepID=UPI001F3C665C
FNLMAMVHVDSLLFFCLACKIRVLLAVPHAHQVKISYYPQNENFVHFARIYCFGEIHIFSLMAM